MEQPYTNRVIKTLWCRCHLSDPAEYIRDWLSVMVPARCEAFGSGAVIVRVPEAKYGEQVRAVPHEETQVRGQQRSWAICRLSWVAR